MKLWRRNTVECQDWTYKITDEWSLTLGLRLGSNASSECGCDELSMITQIFYSSGKPLCIYGFINTSEYDLILEGFNSIEELKALVPEEFI